MITFTTAPAILYLFVVDFVFRRFGLCDPSLSYTVACISCVSPLYLLALSDRLFNESPNLFLEVEVVVTYLSITLCSVTYLRPTEILPSTTRLLFGVVLMHLIVSPPAETLLHRMLFVSTLCQHVKHVTYFVFSKATSLRSIAYSVKRFVTLASFVAISSVVTVDIWKRAPSHLHFVILLALPHVIQLDTPEQESLLPSVVINKLRGKQDELLIDYRDENYDHAGFLTNG